jgi:hypothetical protein
VLVTAAGKPVEVKYVLNNGRLDIILKKKLVLSEGQMLEVSINR